MKCRNCEADLPDQTDVCPWCGYDLKPRATSAPAPDREASPGGNTLSAAKTCYAYPRPPDVTSIR